MASGYDIPRNAAANRARAGASPGIPRRSQVVASANRRTGIPGRPNRSNHAAASSRVTSPGSGSRVNAPCGSGGTG